MTKLPATIGRTMRAAHARHREPGIRVGGQHTVKAGELVEAAFLGGVSPSATARKVFALMLAKAAGEAWEDRWHIATRAQLQQAHQSKARLRDALHELQTTLLEVRTTDNDGKPGVLSGAIVADAFIEDGDDAKAVVRWRFSATMRDVMRRSDHYAELRSQTIAALESRYAVTLYELGCSYYQRRHPVWTGTVEEFRAVLGVPNSYRDWTDIRRRTLAAAKVELNFIALFVMDWKEIRHGRAVERIEVWFWPKDMAARAEAEAEVCRSRVGRKVRREGAIEQVVINDDIQAELDGLRAGKSPFTE
jgi:hypothetical protein